MDWLLERPIAHRGAFDHAAGIPENSLPAFARAADLGAPVELDVHLTADGQPVVVHDVELERLTGAPDRVHALTYRQLERLRLLGTDAHVPRLGEVLDLLAGRVGVMVEVKNLERTAGPLEAAVADVLRGYDGPVTVASFNPRSVHWFAEHAPEVLRGQTASRADGIPVPRLARWLGGRMVTNHWTRPHYLSYDLAGLPYGPVERWRRRGLPLIAWTVRTADDAVKARVVADNFIYEGAAFGGTPSRG